MTGRQKALFARRREGIPAPSGPHPGLDGGLPTENDVGLQLKRNWKPYKELVKIAHPPINYRQNPLSRGLIQTMFNNELSGHTDKSASCPLYLQ